MFKTMILAAALAVCTPVLAGNPIVGDMNNNGGFGSDDVILLANYIFLMGPPPVPCMFTMENVDGDGGCEFTGRFVDEVVSGDDVVYDCCTHLELVVLDPDPVLPGAQPMTDAAADIAIAGANAVAYAGSTDWRLPTASELYSLVNFDDGVEPAIDDTVAGFALLVDLLPLPSTNTIQEEAIRSSTPGVDRLSTVEDESLRKQSLLFREGTVGPFITFGEAITVMVRRRF